MAFLTTEGVFVGPISVRSLPVNGPQLPDLRQKHQQSVALRLQVRPELSNPASLQLAFLRFGCTDTLR